MALNRFPATEIEPFTASELTEFIKYIDKYMFDPELDEYTNAPLNWKAFTTLHPSELSAAIEAVEHLESRLTATEAN